MNPSKIPKVSPITDSSKNPKVSFEDIEPEVWFDFLAVQLPKIDFICQNRQFAYVYYTLQKTVFDLCDRDIWRIEELDQPFDRLRMFLQEVYGSYPPRPLSAELHTATDSIQANLHPDTDSVPADLQTNTDSVPADLHTDTVAVPADLHTDTVAVPADLHLDTVAIPANLHHDTVAIPANLHHDTVAVSYTHLTLPTNREV